MLENLQELIKFIVEAGEDRKVGRTFSFSCSNEDIMALNTSNHFTAIRQLLRRNK